MNQNIIYTYLGDNGTISTGVYLPGINSVVKYQLSAEEGMILTNGKTFAKMIIVPEREVSNWREIPYNGQE